MVTINLFIIISKALSPYVKPSLPHSYLYLVDPVNLRPKVIILCLCMSVYVCVGLWLKYLCGLITWRGW